MSCCHLIGLTVVPITTRKTIRITMSQHGGQLCHFVAENKNGGRNRVNLNNLSLYIKEMDFLFMAVLYTLLFVALSYIIFAGRSEYHRGGWIALLQRNLFSVSSEYHRDSIDGLTN